MHRIPCDERKISDRQVFAALDLEIPGLSAVKAAWQAGNLPLAKKELVGYFEHRQNVTYFYDCRSLPLQPMEPDQFPYAFQSALGLCGRLKDFCLRSGQSMMAHRYLLPGDRGTIDLGANFESMIHFNCLTDPGKRHRHSLDMFVRGQFFEALCVLYHEQGDREVLASFTEIANKFFETYPLVLEDTSPGANHFQYTEDRDVMSTGWLLMVLISLFYTRVPYEIHTDTAFELLKRIWFLGIQFKRFETDSYRPYNHHMWERGLVPFLLSLLLPEIPDFAAYRERGAEIIRRHIMEDFNDAGGYSEHSLAYWSGAAMGEMLFRGVYLARQNDVPLLDRPCFDRIYASFSILAMLAPPGLRYPSLGDNRGTMVNPILDLGEKMVSHPLCREVLNIRTAPDPQPDAGSPVPPAGPSLAPHSPVPLDYHNDQAGFLCSRSSYGKTGNYLLLSAKTNSGCSGHNHMDMLSLFLTFRGQDFIGEPYAGKLYHAVPMASPLRGYLYNMTSHNTVLAHRRPVQPDAVYASRWGVYRPDSPIAGYRSESRGIYARGYHDAYTYCRHLRSLLFFREKGLIIKDEMERGNRLSEPHIQRWHLEFGTTCRRVNEFSVLLEKNGVFLLCVWSGSRQIRIWKNHELCPEIYPSETCLPDILDVSFGRDDNPAVDISTVEVSMLILDVTDTPYRRDSLASEPGAAKLKSLQKQLEQASGMIQEKDALSYFPHL